MTAKQFIKTLGEYKSKHDIEQVKKFFHGDDDETDFLGVRFGTVFKVAKEFMTMPLSEIDALLDNKYYEVRMGAVSIMDYQARSKKISASIRKELFDLYIKRHDRLNDWGFVDRGAPSIVGDYLLDKPRAILYKLAKSKNVWERRTAIVCTYAFIKKGQIDDTFKIAEILVYDKHEMVNNAVGSWIREAGKRDELRLKEFLDTHAQKMPRITLRYAIEKLDKRTRDYYLGLKKS
jgi:3-methyladenine DNA glycosylase AlkD